MEQGSSSDAAALDRLRAEQGDVPPSAEAKLVVSAPSSPGLRMAWLLRSAAIVATIAALLGVLIAPGIPGNASGNVVDLCERASDVFAYATAALLIGLVCVGSYELARTSRLPVATRLASVATAGLVVALAAPALRDTLHPIAAILLAVTSSGVALTATWSGLRAPATRAVTVVLLAMALASTVRLAAWELAGTAGEQGSMRLWQVATGIASVGVVLEGIGQLVAAAWIGTRGGTVGRLASNVAIAAAFLATWGAASGVNPGAAPWQSILHGALADVAGTPPPAGLSAVATFLACCALFLSGAALTIPRQMVAVVASLSLTLLSRGTFDVPLRALAIAVAGQWLLLATVDDRSAWQARIAAREKKADDEAT